MNKAPWASLGGRAGGAGFMPAVCVWRFSGGGGGANDADDWRRPTVAHKKRQVKDEAVIAHTIHP